MKSALPTALVAASIALIAVLPARAQSVLDEIGVTQLRRFDPTLNGSGIVVAQPEAPLTTGGGDWEVNPAAVGQPSTLFTYTSSSGSASGFPNSAGSESSHADEVGDNFYGDKHSTPEGVAYGVSKVENFEADYFYNNVISTLTGIDAKVINQSFIFGSEVSSADQAYDNYIADYNTIIVSGAGNSGAPDSPATSYNGIAVAAYGGASSIGPSSDGRSKPDITAPASFTSFSTPLVSGAAAILCQAGNRGDGGTNTAAAVDARTIKALLLNSAVKPSDWSHTATAPLDPRYGAGILNVFNAYNQLHAGQLSLSASISGSLSVDQTGAVSKSVGWNLATIKNSHSLLSGYQDQTDHYLFDLSASAGSEFTLTSTLTWWRDRNQTAINNLDLYLFNESTGAVISLSDSAVDNVQQLYINNLAPGEYDLAVEKLAANLVTPSETYALALNVTPVPEPGAPALLLIAPPLLAFARHAFARQRRSA